MTDRKNPDAVLLCLFFVGWVGTSLVLSRLISRRFCRGFFFHGDPRTKLDFFWCLSRELDSLQVCLSEYFCWVCARVLCLARRIKLCCIIKLGTAAVCRSHENMTSFNISDYCNPQGLRLILFVVVVGMMWEDLCICVCELSENWLTIAKGLVS